MDGARNPKIQSIYLEKFPIHQAAFAAGGTHVVATSRRKHFYTFDLASASIEKVRSSSLQAAEGLIQMTLLDAYTVHLVQQVPASLACMRRVSRLRKHVLGQPAQIMSSAPVCHAGGWVRRVI